MNHTEPNVQQSDIHLSAIFIFKFKRFFIMIQFPNVNIKKTNFYENHWDKLII